MNAATVRPARTEEAAAIEALIRAAYAEAAAAIPDLPPVAEGVAERLRDATVLVAEGPEGLLGVLVAHLARPETKIENLAVAPEAGGRGVGRTLLEAAAARARAAGAARLILTTHAGMAGTLAFYRRLG
ncbi:MAG: GNAT family N-acetyltransferase, partial [Pseudomonadota bacterium]